MTTNWWTGGARYRWSALQSLTLISAVKKNQTMGLNVQAMNGIVDTNTAEAVSKPLVVFLESINDWRTSPITFEEYVREVEAVIGREATKSSLEKFLTRCDHTKFAWEAESIAGLLDIYKYYDGKSSLRFIVADLESKVGAIRNKMAD